MDQGSAILAVGFLAFGGPLAVDWFRDRRRQKERAIDFARQDVVSAKVDEAAQEAANVARKADQTAALLFDAQKVTIAKTDEVAEAARQSNIQVTDQLRTIHTLVNSDMTAARQGELDQVRLNLVTLRKIVALMAASGKEASDEDEVAIEAAVARIKELEGILADRAAQARVIEAEVKDRNDQEGALS